MLLLLLLLLLAVLLICTVALLFQQPMRKHSFDGFLLSCTLVVFQFFL